MVKFTYKGKEYNYIEYKDMKYDDYPECKYNHYEKINECTYLFNKRNKKNHHKKIEYVIIGAGFDIETSRIPYTKLSTMYVWQFALDDITVVGRTWEEFRSFLKDLQKVYCLHEDRRLLCFIHNEQFEFSFMKRQVSWNKKKLTNKEGEVVYEYPDIFSLDNRQVIKAVSEEFVEFRDSAILTQMPLEKLPENYGLDIEKLKGEVDYKIARHSDTPLEKSDLAYSINDVQILQKFFHNYIWKDFIRNEKDIPLTMTGIVRNELKDTYKKLDKKIKDRHKRLVERCMPDEYTYNIWIKYLFRGGYTHANMLYTDEEIELMDMASQDFKSSYPAVMLQEKFISKYCKADVRLFYSYIEDRKWLKDNGFYGKFKFKNIRSKGYVTLESENKFYDVSQDYLLDNGRLISASELVVYLTDDDYLNYLDVYTWDDVECLELNIGHKEELPKWFKDLVLKYFWLKETLPKDSVEYKLAKARLNSLYGMCVSAILYDNLEYDNISGEMLPGRAGKGYDAIKNKQILLPQWGIQITAKARRRLVHNFIKLGNDAMYSDTDSAKYINAIGNQWVFDTYNDNIRRINNTMYVGKYDRSIFKHIGEFDYEGKYFKFKTLGCKRYLYSQVKVKDGKAKFVHSTTVAGMKKGSLQAYCDKENLDIYKEFRDNLILGIDDSMKLTTHYEDKPFTANFTDYLGNTKEISEKSCCTLYEIPYNLSMASEYIKLISKIEHITERKKRYYV